MINEFKQVSDCPDCETDFVKGDIVRCSSSLVHLQASKFDCGRHEDDIGIVIDIAFYKDIPQSGMSVIICELAIYWAQTDMTSYHLDKYIQKIT